MEPSSLCIYRIKNKKIWITGEKVMTPKVGGSFLQKILDQTTHSLFSNPFKNP
jgi:hypothetical protein